MVNRIAWLLCLLIPSVGTFNAKVEKVLDGDTILLTNGEWLRYIGIDCPEKEAPYFQESTKANNELVTGKGVRLEFDIEARDRYGRLLAYVYIDTIFVNAELIRTGYALCYTVSPNIKYDTLFLRLQREARKEKRGFWAIPKESDEKCYIGSKRSKRFHRPNCKWAKKIYKENKITFKNRDEALDKGYSPCRVCNP